MVAIVTPEQGNSGRYPLDLDLRPTSEPHVKLVGMVTRRADESFSVMSRRHRAWQLIDETMTAYIPLAEYEKNLRKRGGGKEQMSFQNRPVSIVVPHSYAIEDTILTYLTQAFLSNPIFPYEGVGPEDEIPAKLLEIVVAQQVNRFKAQLEIHAAFRDILRYGICSSTMEWRVLLGRKPVVREQPVYSFTGEQVGTERFKENVEAVLFEGNKVSNIDPYRLLPDPNVSIHRVQDGEFFGWSEIIDYQTLIAQENAGTSGFFNVKFLQGSQKSSKYTPDQSARKVFSGGGIGEGIVTPNTTRKVTIVNMFVLLIPNELGLGDGVDPELWLMTIANDTLLIRLQPLNLNHNQIPVAVGASEYDGYSITPVSRIEMMYGMQNVLNWEFNSHVANVRKAINDMFVVDPSMVHMPDMEDPEPGKLIRLRRSAWGRGVKEAVAQLSVNDITRANIQDASVIADIMNRTSSASDGLQGVARQGSGRRSAAEFQGTSGGALKRMERTAWVISIMYMQDLAYFYASHTQQLMSEDVYRRQVGEWPDVLKETYGRSVNITPFDIIADFDVTFKDGSPPGGGQGGAEVWVQLFQAIAGDEEIRGQFDIPRLFQHVARVMGARNVHDFMKKGGNIQSQVLPDAEVAAQAAAGNVVPIGQAQ